MDNIEYSDRHNGIDIVGANDDLLALYSGEVFYLTENDGTGCKTIVIKHTWKYGLTLLVQYSHCASFEVKVGDKVSKGDKVATMGNTGRSTGKHLHCSMYVLSPLNEWVWNYKTRSLYEINPNEILNLY